MSPRLWDVPFSLKLHFSAFSVVSRILSSRRAIKNAASWPMTTLWPIYQHVSCFVISPLQYCSLALPWETPEAYHNYFAYFRSLQSLTSMDVWKREYKHLVSLWFSWKYLMSWDLLRTKLITSLSIFFSILHCELKGEICIYIANECKMFAFIIKNFKMVFIYLYHFQKSGQNKMNLQSR